MYINSGGTSFSSDPKDLKRASCGLLTFPSAFGQFRRRLLLDQ
jgi:hypothetical protein